MDSRTKIINKIRKDTASIAPGLILCAIYISIMTALRGTVCPFRIFLGIPCPGCGLSRAALLLLSGDIGASFQMHPMLFLIIIGMIWLVYGRYFSPCQDKHMGWLKIYLVISVFLFVSVYLVRMKLYFPMREPMVFEPDNIMGDLLPEWGKNWLKN